MSAKGLRSTRRGGGFSLLELLAVIGIVLILAAAVVPSVTGILRSSTLTNGSQMLADTLNLARQTALTNNSPVEVRIYKMGGPASAGDLQYRAFRLFTVNENNGKQAIGNLRRLPEPLIISSSPTYSTLTVSGSSKIPPSASPRSERSSLPEDYPVPDQTSYVSFRFRPNGGTDLTPIEGTGSNWFLTLVMENAPGVATGLPANYFTVQIDPVTGRARSFRP